MTASNGLQPKGVIHGYARCSTTEMRQDIDRQVRELKSAGAQKIWLEYEHGDSVTKEQQALMFETAKEGDTILVLEVPRLARSVKQLCDIIDIVRTKRLRLVIQGSVTMDCRTDCPDPMTEAFLQIAGVFSQLELAMIRARVKSGMENAKAKGKKIGRPATTLHTIPEKFLKYYALYKAQELTVAELARLASVSRQTAYKYLRLIEQSKPKQ